MLELNKPKDIAEYINDNYTPKVKNFLFGSEYIDRQEAVSFSTLYRVIAMTFSCIYAKWLKSGRACYAKSKGRRAHNVFKLLYLVYRSRPLDADVMLYVISEGRRDYLEYGEESFFSEFFDSSVAPKYSKTYDILRESFESAEANYQKVIFEHMKSIAIDMKVMRELSLELSDPADEKCHWKNVKLCFGGEIYPTYDSLVYMRDSLCLMEGRTLMSDCLERHYREFLTLESKIDRQ